MEGHWLHRWIDETSWFDPYRQWNFGCECFEREYSMWIPDSINPNDDAAIDDYIERQWALIR